MLLFICISMFSSCALQSTKYSHTNYSNYERNPIPFFELVELPNGLGAPVKIKVEKQLVFDHGVAVTDIGWKGWKGWLFNKHIVLRNEYHQALLGVIEFPLGALEEQACGEVLLKFQIDHKGNLQNAEIIGEELHPAISNHLINTLDSIEVSPVYKARRKALNKDYYTRFTFASSECEKRRLRIKRIKNKPKYRFANWLYKVYLPKE